MNLKYEEAIECYEKAVQLDPNNSAAFHGWGVALSKIADFKQDETLYKNAFDKYDKAVQLESIDSINAYIYYNWGYGLYRLAKIKQDEDLFKKAFEKYSKVIEIDSDFVSAFFYWGLALLRLAEIKQDIDFQKNLEAFERASSEINDSDTYLIKGEIYFLLNKTEKTMEYFKKSKKDVLEILTFLDKKNEEKIINTNILHSLLNSDDNGGAFFKEAIKKLPPEQKDFLDTYKEVYIRSIFIISLLHVKDDEEEFVAHYREKKVSQVLLFSDDNKLNKFRLNAIDFSNDLSEGKTLLDFIYGKEKRPSDNDLYIDEYEAFASCFVFDYDSLNLFRLYGKEDSREGTGLSLVFRDTFFNKKPKMALESPKKESQNINNANSIREEKSALFRCIYIDPNPITNHSVVFIGRKDKYLFYREDKKDDYEVYNQRMNGIIDRVNKEMDYLKDKAEKLNPAIVGQLLLNLRYLVKHVAFKDEQECRIVKILNLSKDKESVKDDCRQMYLEYPPKVTDHIEKIYFGPKAEGFELFKSMLKYKGLNIPCYKSENPLA